MEKGLNISRKFFGPASFYSVHQVAPTCWCECPGSSKSLMRRLLPWVLFMGCVELEVNHTDETLTQWIKCSSSCYLKPLSKVPVNVHHAGSGVIHSHCYTSFAIYHNVHHKFGDMDILFCSVRIWIGGVQKPTFIWPCGNALQQTNVLK